MKKEFKDMNQKDFWDYVNLFDSAIEGIFDCTNYSWFYKDNFKLSTLKIDGFTKTSDWVTWITIEQSVFLFDIGYDRYGDIEKEWIPNPTIEPVILIKMKNGLYDIVDGWHRTALAFKNNLNQIPVIVGEEI